MTRKVPRLKFSYSKQILIAITPTQSTRKVLDCNYGNSRRPQLRLERRGRLLIVIMFTRKSIDCN